MATPALRAIRAGFPQAHISWLVRSAVSKVVENLPYRDELLDFDDRSKHGRTLRFLACSMRLRQQRFDTAVILPNSFGSALMVFLAGIKRRVGYSRDGRGFLLTDSIQPVRNENGILPMPMVEYYLRIADTLHCPRVSGVPELRISAAARQKADAVFDQYRIPTRRQAIAMVPGAAYGASKCWRPEYFAAVADRLIRERRCTVLILPGPEEVEIARKIATCMSEKPAVLADPVVPLDVLMAIIDQCSLLITNDTGPRHFAVALDIPVVVIMGPTDPRYTDLNLDRTIVLRETLDCSPCHVKVCPHDHRCMTRITPDKVIQAAERLLMEFGRSPG